MAHGPNDENTHSTVDTGHPTAFTYFKVAMILSAITAVRSRYLLHRGAESTPSFPILVVLSGTKFALVAMFYMHLRYDAKLFSGLFVGGLTLAFGVGLSLLALFQFFV